jgi:hypothetical protein
MARSVGPILDADSGDSSEVRDIASDHDIAIDQRDRSDPEIIAADSQFQSTQGLELFNGWDGKAQDDKVAQIADGFRLLGIAVGNELRRLGFADGGVPARKLFLDRNDRRDH